MKEQRTEKRKEKEHLPRYGVGPYYTIGIVALTAIGVILSCSGVLDSGKIAEKWLIVLFVAAGVVTFVIGFLIWAAAALGAKSIDKYINSNTLCTTGIYSVVRNPIYSGLVLNCTGVLLIAHNVWLLILPFIFWIALTILMKCSEEKWLLKLYGDQYVEYCKRVNRCIPWFPKK